MESKFTFCPKTFVQVGYETDAIIKKLDGI